MKTIFWERLSSCKIEIPEIQRDYAQGRKSKRVDAIRQAFVSDLLNAISTGQKLNLDFIFGQSVDKTKLNTFHRSKQSLEQMLQVLKQYSEDTGVAFKSEVSPKPTTNSNERILIPFDGQQRLTTLFLLHLYIGAISGNDISILKNFNYKTRESSSLFIGKLLDAKAIKEFIPDESSKENHSISAYLQNQHWFFNSWKKDPTVAGMLVMLDEIEQQVMEKPINLKEAWNNLTKYQCIEFDFYDIQKDGFEEDLYVKMNARGKGLTEFENFRAWLEKKQKSNKSLNKYGWSNKLDKDWLDIFWNTKDKISDVDVNFMAYFKNMALLFRLSKTETKGKKDYTFEQDLTNLLKANRENYTPTVVYENNDIFNKDSLDFIFKTLDCIANDKESHINMAVSEVWTDDFKRHSDNSFTVQLLTEYTELNNLFHKTFFFAVLQFLYINAKQVDEYQHEDWSRFKEWLRVARNIIYNSRIDDISAYIPAIVAIAKIDKEIILNTYKALSELNEDESKNWITYYPAKQRLEESEKVALLTTESGIRSNWAELIYKAEEHFYFYGQIDFIFKLANNDIFKFEEYLNKLVKLFSAENVFSKECFMK